MRCAAVSGRGGNYRRRNPKSTCGARSCIENALPLKRGGTHGNCLPRLFSAPPRKMLFPQLLFVRGELQYPAHISMCLGRCLTVWGTDSSPLIGVPVSRMASKFPHSLLISALRPTDTRLWQFHHKNENLIGSTVVELSRPPLGEKHHPIVRSNAR